jgi:hypothetical protein
MKSHRKSAILSRSGSMTEPLEVIMPQNITLSINGMDQTVSVETDSMLLYALRNNLGLHGPRFGCAAGGKKPQGAGKPVQGRGIAWVNRDDVRVATIADVTVDPASGQIKVGRVVVAHDCGLVVNPDGLRNQVEGNVIQPLSCTLHEEVTFDRVHVTSRDWEAYPILRFSDIPDSIDVVLVNNTPQYPSYGAGEPATNPTAAVISNAVFDAIGVRL